jgi:sporulation protein YlmC with PRC-barrel domain
LALGAAFVVMVSLIKPIPAVSQVVQLVKVDVSAVAKGFRAKKMLGTKVMSEKRESIGALDDLIIDENRKIFAVLEVGGFLGLGGHLVAVPYESLKISDDGKTIELPGATRDALTALAEFHYSS